MENHGLIIKYILYLYEQFLPHTKLSVLENCSPGATDSWNILPRFLVAKIIPKHRTYPTYNISQPRPKRISTPKVVLILLLTFIFPTHGS